MPLTVLVARDNFLLLGKGLLRITCGLRQLQEAHRLALERLLAVNEELLDSKLLGLSVRLRKRCDFHFLIASTLTAPHLLECIIGAPDRIEDTFVIQVKL